jgi:hypothetical protein
MKAMKPSMKTALSRCISHADKPLSGLLITTLLQ